MPRGLLVTPQLDQWARQWDQLVGQSPLPSPFLRSWWLTGTGGRRRRFLLVVHDDRLLGGLALEEERRVGLPRLRMMGSGPLCPDHLDLLAAAGHEDSVVRAVRAWLGRPGARLVDLEGIRPGSALIRALPGRVRCEPLAVAPWARLSVTADAYLAGRPPNFRRNLRKARARMAAQGAAYRINRGQSAVGSLETLRRLHTAQWGGRSRFLPGFDRFAAACRLGAESDEVAVHELHVDGTVIAIMVSFEVAGRVSLYQSARLTDFGWRDATMVLLASTICDACGRGFAEVDLLRGSERYKDNFAPQRRELLRLRTASAWAGRAGIRAELAAGRAGAAGRRLLPSRPSARPNLPSPDRTTAMTEAPDQAPPGPADVAVIIPAFNSGTYLDQALASVAGQTVNPAIVVVVDDCSSDDTSERARRWQGRLPLELIRLERNRGPGAARHCAIQATNTALLAMLDADDLFLPDHLETMAATYRGCPALVSAQVLSWYPGQQLTGPAKARLVPRTSYQLGALLRHNFVTFPLFSRDLYESAGGFGGQYLCEDWNLWIRMVRAGAEVIMASHPTVVSRQRPGSLSFDSVRITERSIDVLIAELHVAGSPAEARAARAGLRALRGKLSYYRATELAAQRRPRQARQAAFEGLPGGSPRDAVGLLALLAAPSAAARLERLRRPHRLPVDRSRTKSHTADSQ